MKKIYLFLLFQCIFSTKIFSLMPFLVCPDCNQKIYGHSFSQHEQICRMSKKRLEEAKKKEAKKAKKEKSKEQN